MTYPYVASPEKLKTLLNKMATEVGIPGQCNIKFLRSLGYTSSNDNKLLGAVKFIGLVDDGGTPTELWSELRANSKVAVAKGVRQGYVDLFSQYPDAHLKDDEAVRTFFSAHTSLGSQAITKIVRTFKALCEIGEFSGAQPTASTKTKSAAKDESKVPKTGSAEKTDTVVNTQEIIDGITVNINVQLQVPPDATGDIYDKFFEAMRKHLWPS
jgi:hypothetical protein